MYAAALQPVLRCRHCNKPFDKESTLKRHGYYCRSRKSVAVSQSRSCNSCARAKVRCDNKQPQCSRCLRKALDCNYPQSRAPKKASRTPLRNDTPLYQPEIEPSMINSPRIVKTRQNGVASQGIESDILNIDYANMGLDYFDPNLDIANLSGVQTNNERDKYLSLESTSWSRWLPSSADKNTMDLQQLAPLPDPLMQTLLTSNLRSFNLRQKHKPSAQRVAQLIFYTLKSYPRMMLRDNTLPPFIHPYMVSSHFENKDMEPLTNCMSLLRMRRSQLQGSRKLFWKNVRMECERLHADYAALNKWELLAAMQALSIYTLIRLDEGETDDNSIDSLLVTTVIVLATQFKIVNMRIGSGTEVARRNDMETSWREWMLEESARRLCVVYQVVNLLVYFEPAAMCEQHQFDLLLAPLPAKKQLWEADSEHAWKNESDRDPGTLESAFGLAANGDLVRFNNGEPHCTDVPALPSEYSNTTTVPATSAASWDEWCAGMDGLGGLIMLAASLVA